MMVTDCAFTEFVSSQIVDRGMALNADSGWLSTLSPHSLWLFEPIGGSGFALRARFDFDAEDVLSAEDVRNSRLRFVGHKVFIWSFAKWRVLQFAVTESALILEDVLRDQYFKDSKAMDIAVSGNLFILLFDRWLGLYRFEPTFKWYHAVAFANKSVHCFSVELGADPEHLDHDDLAHDKDDDLGDGDGQIIEKATNRNYLFINAEDQIIGVHPSNPMFDFLHIAQGTK